MSLVQNIYSAFFRLNNNAFTFLSGIFISTAVNFYTTVSFSKEIMLNFTLSLAILFMFISSLLWLILAITLQPFQDTFKKTHNNLLNVQDLWLELINKKIGNLIFITNTAIALSIMSFILIRI